MGQNKAYLLCIRSIIIFQRNEGRIIVLFAEILDYSKRDQTESMVVV